MFGDPYLDLVSETASHAARLRCQDLQRGDIVNEDDFSSSLMTYLRDGLNALCLKYVYGLAPGLGPRAPAVYTVHARATDNRYPGSEENLSGADILMSFREHFDGDDIREAALVQMKLFTGQGPLLILSSSTNKREYILAQCNTMIGIAAQYFYIDQYI